MMRSAVLLISLSVSVTAAAAEAEIQLPPLTLTYSRDAAICAAAERTIGIEAACRAFDETACPNPGALSFRPVASEQYGYTEVARAPELPGASFTIVYLQRFRGNQTPRQLETWKVDSTHLREIFALPPGIISFEDRYRFHPGPKTDLPADTNAKEFRALLNASEKLSGEWSPTVELEGKPHTIVRECAGSWRYGGYYHCTRVEKLTFLSLSAGGPAERSCEFSHVAQAK